MSLSTEPFEPYDHAVVEISTARALRERDPGERADPCDQWADRSVTLLVALLLDADGRLYGHAKGAVGHPHEITGVWFERWAEVTFPAWQRHGMDSQGWARVVDLLRDRVRERDARERAALPDDVRRAAELVEERRATDRRAELKRQRADADAELARLDAGEPVNTEPSRPRRMDSAPPERLTTTARRTAESPGRSCRSDHERRPAPCPG